MSEQATIDPFREMNRYKDREAGIPSDAVYEAPRRTLQNGWQKFHAARDCGSNRVRYVEETNHRMHGSEKYEYYLRCSQCGFEVDEEEVLFIGGEWYRNHGWETYGRSIDELRIPEGRVVELGTDPEQEEVKRVLNLGRIEREGSGLTGFSFGNGTWYECSDCGNEAPLTYDGKCRMCYDGEWTDRMHSELGALANAIRVQNRSFKHRLESHVNPLHIKGRAFTEKILWRRGDDSDLPKMVEVTQCLIDDEDGHREYILEDPDREEMVRLTEDELAEKFWDTELYSGQNGVFDHDEHIAEVWERVKDK